MPLPQTPPGRGGRRAHVHWVYVSTPPGKKWPAHIAGPCHWFCCHTKGRSKPCLSELTGGELTCEVCSPFEVPQVLGYQPLYHGKDGRPCQVIVHDYARDQVDSLKLHHPVTVERGDGPTDTVSLLPMLGAGHKYTSTLAERLKPADLTETLLRMWRLPELTEWYRSTCGATAPASASPPPPPPPLTKRKRGDEKPFSLMMQGAANKYEFPEVVPPDNGLDDALQRVKAREAAMKPSTNGKH